MYFYQANNRSDLIGPKSIIFKIFSLCECPFDQHLVYQLHTNYTSLYTNSKDQNSPLKFHMKRYHQYLVMLIKYKFYVNKIDDYAYFGEIDENDLRRCVFLKVLVAICKICFERTKTNEQFVYQLVHWRLKFTTCASFWRIRDSRQQCRLRLACFAKKLETLHNLHRIQWVTN